MLRVVGLWLRQCCGDENISFGSGSAEPQIRIYQQGYKKQFPQCWIRDILVRIRIRLSVPLTCGSGSGLFVGGFQDANKNRFLCKSQNSRNQGFPYFFCSMMGRIRICTKNEGSGRPKNPRILLIWIHNINLSGYWYPIRKKFRLRAVYGSDPNPQHGISGNLLLYNKFFRKKYLFFLSEGRF